MKRRIVLCLIVCLVVLSLAAGAAGTIWLQANQSVAVRCIDPAGEILVEFYGDDEVEVTCRVWVTKE